MSVVLGSPPLSESRPVNTEIANQEARVMRRASPRLRVLGITMKALILAAVPARARSLPGPIQGRVPPQRRRIGCNARDLAREEERFERIIRLFNGTCRPVGARRAGPRPLRGWLQPCGVRVGR